jgi:predicted transcriptional regulator
MSDLVKIDYNAIVSIAASKLLTMAEVAERSNMPLASLYNLRGKKGVKPLTVHKVANGLGVDVSAILKPAPRKRASKAARA